MIPSPKPSSGAAQQGAAPAERRTDDELRRRLRQQAAVAELGREALAGAGVAAVARSAVAMIAEELGVPFVVLLAPDGDRGSLTLRAQIGMPEELRALEAIPAGDAGQMGYTLREGRAVVSPELSEETRFAPPQRMMLSGARSSACVPVGVHGGPFGVLAAASRRQDDFSDHDVNFLQGMANILSAAVDRERAQQAIADEHARLEQALKRVSEDEERFRELANSAPVFIWTATPDGLIDFINRGWLDYTGNSLDDELGDSWALGVHPDDQEGVTGSWASALDKRVPWEREYRLRRRDGAYRWIVDRGVPLFSDDGELRAYVGTATDIHERKQMEQQLSVAYERDHEVAEVLQRSLLPERLPVIDGLRLEARYLPASRGAMIGGDWYDAIELDDGRVAVVVGDVVGHGLRAATVMGQLRNAFRAYALLNGSASQTLSRLNRLLMRDGRELMATVLFMLLDRDTGAISYASAGHPPPLVVSEDGETRFLEGGRSVPLGTSDARSFARAEDVIAAGSTVLLYTDGLIERRDTPLEERFAQLAAVAGGADGDLSEVCDQVLDGVLGGARPSDDIALLALRPEPAPTGSLSLRLAADPAALAQLRRRLGRFASANAATATEEFEVVLAVSEAAMNAIEHAYGPGDAEFTLEASVDDGVLSARIRDTGQWRDRRDGDRGRGLSIIKALMDGVEVRREAAGTTISMHRRLATGDDG